MLGTVRKCAARHSGSLDTDLPEATRLPMIRSDVSVPIHADAGDEKPLNCGSTLGHPLRGRDHVCV